MEEMEKRSRRRARDLVTQAASQGLSQNEIGCARISMMARSTTAPYKGRIQMRKTNPLHFSNSGCNARPVHTVGSGVETTHAEGRCGERHGHGWTMGACCLPMRGQKYIPRTGDCFLDLA